MIGASMWSVLCGVLEWPCLVGLIGLGAWTLLAAGGCLREALQRRCSPMVRATPAVLARRIQRPELVARLAPMLGLAGTLIPLGPGLEAFGRGAAGELADRFAFAFGTTVLGVAIAVVATIIASLRRAWYLAEPIGAPAGAER